MSREYVIENYSNKPAGSGKVLLIGIGGAGIPKEAQVLNENLKKGLDFVPYLENAASKIDYVMLLQKDSADLTPDDMAQIPKIISIHQNEYDGFVVISGSDAIVYVAAATAFALRGLGMPVIFIGARQTSKDWDSDFRLNLPNAIKTAMLGHSDVNLPSVGECAILFDDTLTRATVSISRGTKVNNPIESPRLPRLAEIGWAVKVEQIAIPRKPPQLNFSLNTNNNVAYFDLVSQTNLDSFEVLVEDSSVHGIVIGAFGAGNVPSSLVPLIHRAVYEKGKLVAVITNCKKGSSDMGLYDCGALALKAGSISLGPMTKPAAIEKMRWAINNAQGEDKLSFQKDAARLLLTEIAGEIPTSYSRRATNMLKETFMQELVQLGKFYKTPEMRKYNKEIKSYAVSTKSKYKILVISTGGTFFQEPNPHGSLVPTKRSLKELLDKKFSGIGTLVSLDYCELLNVDSTEVEHPDRTQMAKLIAENMSKYDGFLVLHGTDTMAYTAASLSFMLVGLNKDVLITGSQKPGFDFSDFDRNFIKAVKAILQRLNQKESERVRAGVKVAFGDKLITGTTAMKEDEHGINAFAPVPKHPLAGTLCNPIELYNVISPPKIPFTLFTEFDTHSAYYECTCGGNLKQFEKLVDNPKISAILIGGLDEGNMPLQLKYYIANAVNSHNKPVAFVSNTDYGIAQMTKEGRFGEFIKAGAISLGNMTKEAAFQKLNFTVGLANKQKDLNRRRRMEFIRRVLHTNLAGEISEEACTKAKVVYAGIFNEGNKEMFAEEEIIQRIISSTDLPKQNGKLVAKKSVKVKNTLHSSL